MPKIVDHDQYRKELATSSFDLFAEKGYGSVTMRQIAESLGVSTGTLYHYFPSKKALFEQLAEQISQRDVLIAGSVMSGVQTLEERLEVLGAYLVKNEDYYIKWLCVLIDFCQHQDREEIKNSVAFRRVDQLFLETFYTLLGIQDPTLASFVMCLFDGLIVERLWGNKMVSFPEQLALLGKMLTAYVERQPPQIMEEKL